MVDSSIFSNKNLKEIASMGNFHVLEHEKDLSISSSSAVNHYFASTVKRYVIFFSLELSTRASMYSVVSELATGVSPLILHRPSLSLVEPAVAFYIL